MRLIDGLISGAKNMLSVALATATAGIVVGIVTMGLGGMIVQIVEYLSAGNIFLLLFITAIASLVLGMGLPTTATYIVMASITVPVIVNLSPISAVTGVALIPAIAAHLFCFYFGILADDTPPVGLAAYAASAIAESDPIATGVQGFLYDLAGHAHLYDGHLRRAGFHQRRARLVYRQEPLVRGASLSCCHSDTLPPGIYHRVAGSRSREPLLHVLRRPGDLWGGVSPAKAPHPKGGCRPCDPMHRMKQDLWVNNRRKLWRT